MSDHEVCNNSIKMASYRSVELQLAKTVTDNIDIKQNHSYVLGLIKPLYDTTTVV